MTKRRRLDLVNLLLHIAVCLLLLLEGAVRLGFSKELAAIEDTAEREALFDRLVAEAYERGKATEAASHLEIDAVIDPVDTRAVILRSLAASN